MQGGTQWGPPFAQYRFYVYHGAGEAGLEAIQWRESSNRLPSGRQTGEEEVKKGRKWRKRRLNLTW